MQTSLEVIELEKVIFQDNDFKEVWKHEAFDVPQETYFRKQFSDYVYLLELIDIHRLHVLQVLREYKEYLTTRCEYCGKCKEFYVGKCKCP